ncbi:hypothetical protein RRG08_047486 [Elysia crispata]|uniref:Uncharacterized protein n=1 Tax=Elysia crispata TaxID=231223 RepID=A0AAE0XZ92_9GAST|nr:hypothetical protein RRG08_047486 [Elysia crispata]
MDMDDVEEISEEVQEDMEREANFLVEHAVQTFIQNSPLMRDHLYVVTDEGRASTSGSEESSEEEESDQDSDDTEAQQGRSQGTGGVVDPRLNMILPDDLILEDLAAIWMTDTEFGHFTLQFYLVAPHQFLLFVNFCYFTDIIFGG